jgi:hypothetical protein
VSRTREMFNPEIDIFYRIGAVCLNL